MRTVLERFRFLAVIAVIGLAVTAAATFGWSVAKSVKFVSDLLSGEWRNELMVVKLLQVIDTYLLAVVQLITAVGLYELFIGDIDAPGVDTEVVIQKWGIPDAHGAAAVTEAERLGYAVLVAEGSALVMAMIQTGQIEAIVGVSCMPVLEKTVYALVALSAVVLIPKVAKQD